MLDMRPIYRRYITAMSGAATGYCVFGAPVCGVCVFAQCVLAHSATETIRSELHARGLGGWPQRK